MQCRVSVAPACYGGNAQRRHVQITRLAKQKHYNGLVIIILTRNPFQHRWLRQRSINETSHFDLINMVLMLTTIDRKFKQQLTHKTLSNQYCKSVMSANKSSLNKEPPRNSIVIEHHILPSHYKIFNCIKIVLVSQIFCNNMNCCCLIRTKMPFFNQITQHLQQK